MLDDWEWIFQYVLLWNGLLWSGHRGANRLGLHSWVFRCDLWWVGLGPGLLGLVNLTWSGIQAWLLIQVRSWSLLCRVLVRSNHDNNIMLNHTPSSYVMNIKISNCILGSGLGRVWWTLHWIRLQQRSCFYRIRIGLHTTFLVDNLLSSCSDFIFCCWHQLLQTGRRVQSKNTSITTKTHAKPDTTVVQKILWLQFLMLTSHQPFVHFFLLTGKGTEGGNKKVRSVVGLEGESWFGSVVELGGSSCML